MYYTFSISKDFHGRVTLSVHDADGRPVALNVKLPDDSAYAARLREHFASPRPGVHPAGRAGGRASSCPCGQVNMCGLASVEGAP